MARTRAQLILDLKRKADQGKPGAARGFIESHPGHLMQYMGWQVEEHHARALSNMLTQDKHFWLAPRGSGKSTCALYMAVWLALSNPEYRSKRFQNLFPCDLRTIDPSNIRIALTSNSADRAIDLHQQARSVLEHDLLATIYDGSMRGSLWQTHKSTSRFRTAQLREGTFTAMGLGSKVTGGHYDWILVDDWVTEDNARTETQRKRLQDFYNFTVRPTLEPWGRLVGCGTRYHPADWYAWVHEQAQLGEWHLHRDQALVMDEDGKPQSYWPAAYSVEQLLKLKEEVGAIAFATQYQNEVDMMRGDFFPLGCFEHEYKWEDLPRVVQNRAKTVIALDPAIKGGPRNDYSVFTVLSFAAPHFYVRHVERGQWTDRDTMSMALRLCHQWRAREFGVEVVGGLEFLANALKRQPGMPRVRVLRPLQFRGKDKVGRASQVRKFFEQGRVWVPEMKTPGIKRMVEECMAFPSQSQTPGMDDCVDSLVWALLMLTRTQTRLVKYGRSV